MDKSRGLADIMKLKLQSTLVLLRNCRWHGRVARACRLPPKLTGVTSVTRDSEPDEVKWNWSDPSVRKVLVVSAFVTIVASWVFIVPYDTRYFPEDGTAQVVPMQSIRGTPGQQTAPSEYAAGHDVMLLNESPFVGSPQWFENSFSASRFVNGTQAGVYLKLNRAQGEFGGETEYWRIINLALRDYSDVVFSAGIQVLSGHARCMIHLMFTESPSLHSSPYAFLDYPLDAFGLATTSLISRGENATLSLHVPLDDLKSHFSGWLVQSWFYISIAANESTAVMIRSAQVRVTSTDLLCPLSIDLESTNGSSLFDNSFVKWAESYPLVNLTRDNGSEGYSVFRPNRCYDLIYVKPGTYSGEAAWWGRNDTIMETGYEEAGRWVNDVGSYPVQVNVSIGPDTGLSLSVRIPAARLFLEVSPLPPVVSLTISQSYAKGAFDVYVLQSLNSPLPAYVYLPALNSSPEVWLTNSLYWASTPYLAKTIQMGGTEDLRLVADIPHWTVLGVAADPLAGLRIAICITLFFLCVILGILYTGDSSVGGIVRNPVILSIACLFASMIVPWHSFTIRYQDGSGPPTMFSISSFVQAQVALGSNYSGSLFLGADFFSLPGLVAFLFWFPLFIVGARLALSKKSAFDWLTLVLLAMPALLYSNSHWFSFFARDEYGFQFELGFFLSLAAPLLYTTEYVSRRLAVRMREHAAALEGGN